MTDNSRPVYRGVLRTVAAVVGLVLCSFCFWVAMRMGLSRLLSTYAAGRGADISTAQRFEAADAAVAISPSDPEAHLIRAVLLKADGKLAEAIREYEQAAALRPRDYVLWLELGLARDEADDRSGALNAFEEAVALAPDYAEPRWQLGNILLRAGRTEEAFVEMRRAVQSNRALLPQLIDLAWTIHNGDVATVEQLIQPQGSPALLALARFAARQGKAADAARIFLTAEEVSQEDRRAFLTELLTTKQFKVAYEVWAKGQLRTESGFTDGGFEGQISIDEPGFGWRIPRNLQAIQVSIDKVQPHAGNSSLRLDWSGDSPPTSSIVSQIIVVEPDARYRLNFSVRTEELVTGGLPLIAVLDASSKESQQLAQSGPFPEKTAPWQEYNVEFSTGKETQAVLVVLRRQGCTSGPCPIFGRVWLDGFSIKKL